MTTRNVIVLESFLKKEDVWKQFKLNLTDDIESLKIYDPTEWVKGAFTWSITPEDFKFWNHLDDKWRARLKGKGEEAFIFLTEDEANTFFDSAPKPDEPIIFQEYLKAYGVKWKKFKKLLKKSGKVDYPAMTSSISWISNAFAWDKTKEGHNFWSNLNKLWQDIVEHTIATSDKPIYFSTKVFKATSRYNVAEKLTKILIEEEPKSKGPIGTYISLQGFIESHLIDWYKLLDLMKEYSPATVERYTNGEHTIEQAMLWLIDMFNWHNTELGTEIWNELDDKWRKQAREADEAGMKVFFFEPTAKDLDAITDGHKPVYFKEFLESHDITWAEFEAAIRPENQRWFHPMYTHCGYDCLFAKPPSSWLMSALQFVNAGKLGQDIEDLTNAWSEIVTEAQEAGTPILVEPTSKPLHAITLQSFLEAHDIDFDLYVKQCEPYNQQFEDTVLFHKGYSDIKTKYRPEEWIAYSFNWDCAPLSFDTLRSLSEQWQELVEQTAPGLIKLHNTDLPEWAVVKTRP